MRGEEIAVGWCAAWSVEIPPHARRRELNQIHNGSREGNTSACAEKSGDADVRGDRRGKYLRMRGEEGELMCPDCHELEIPPHARRRDITPHSLRRSFGNTSACAEKSSTRSPQRYSTRKYLRMRGEEREKASSSDSDMEIPPHARRRVFLTWGFIFCGAGFSTARVIRCWQGGGHPCQ